jgi:diadenosine tetraphosphate (Ap4A) HIT family hydrolase
MPGDSHEGLKAHATVFRYWNEPLDIADKCIFCKVGRGDMKPGVNEEGELVLENAHAACFHDIAPSCEHHFLVTPKAHVKNCWGFETAEHLETLKGMRSLGHAALDHVGVDKRQLGFIRPPFNSIFHAHMHAMSLPLRLDQSWVYRTGFSSSFFFLPIDSIIKQLEERLQGPGSKL